MAGGLPSVLVRARAHLLLVGENPQAVVAALDEKGARAPLIYRMEARSLLWKYTRDRTHLDEARRLLDEALRYAPAECRETMIENVPLHRAIHAAAAD